MKKTERINTIMRYINNRAHFTISEIMSEFAISRSTAIRDLREIEQMGLPLIAEVGRDGGYSVLQNSFLPSVHFTDDEVKALFIAFMATRNQQLPYLKSRQSLSEKLIGLLSENQQDELVYLNEVLLFEGTNPYNPDLLDLTDLPDPTLEKLIQALLKDRYLICTFTTGKIALYLVHLYQQKSAWFIEGIIIETREKHVFAVEELIDIAVFEGKHPKNIAKNYVAAPINLILTLEAKAIAQFKKYHPFRLTLAYLNPFQTKARLETVVGTNPEEVSEMVNWLLFLGEDLYIERMPDEIREELIRRTKKHQSVL
ncbi:helix-turn-helix transcriptional regulator [Candidatus Enterococcus willemsii]|uniref:Decaprenyl diphosphate synthase n=1 Tax=Candidatus Enterococcus willemsii TaxID=1857215 RepID=A0ABQ6YW93_9ENTE|nr:HTH domain-containing protein [Enterococcus sp. CU12B]KAF1301967.1 decaprenyl diphosphate synthase [Enterococcus sp. CU12B]